MSTVRVTNPDLGGLVGDLRSIATSTPRRMAKVVKNAAQNGNRIAKAHAEEEHTMFSDVDADYAPTFTVERVGPLTYEYGPTHSKAPGYEFGSINQASPHRNLDRSLEVEAVEFPLDVSDEMRFIFAENGF